MIVHILKDGKQIKDIKGHKVKKKDVPEFYELVNRIKRSNA